MENDTIILEETANSVESLLITFFTKHLTIRNFIVYLSYN